MKFFSQMLDWPLARPKHASNIGKGSRWLTAETQTKITRLWPLAALGFQNVAIFWGHYFGDVGFPWDFYEAYYGMVAFWTTILSQGIFPQWMPFQQMGYPFVLQLQSGMYYPPLWVFPLLQIPYTLNAAVVVQCLHVLLGSIGMFVLLKENLDSAELAFIGAFIFQLFGGYYSNSEHADIIRAFALAPWLFYVFTIDSTDGCHLRRNALFIPLVLLFLATGGYPGNLISSTFMLGLFVLFQLIQSFFKGVKLRALVAVGASIAALTFLGVALAAVQLGPAWEYRDLLVRYDRFQYLAVYTVWFEQLPGLFLSSRTLPGEISMTSTYVTLPAVVFLSFVPLSSIKQYWTYLGIGAIGFLMAGGDKSPLWVMVTALVPFLRYSRFPSSDYRVFIAIPIILLAMLALRAIAQKEQSRLSVVGRVTFVFAWFCLGIYATYPGMWTRQVLAAGVLAAATLLFLVCVWYWQFGLQKSVLLAVVLLVSIDGLRVLPDMGTWQFPEISSSYSKFGWPYKQDDQLVTNHILEDLPKRRPARQEPPIHFFSWGGYIDGRFLMQDKNTTFLLQAAQNAQTNPIYKEYMRLQWTPLLLDPGSLQIGTHQAIRLESVLSDYLSSDENKQQIGVEQIFYGINDITYRVSLSEPKLMVENEIYFPGWEGRVMLPDRELQLQALAANGIFRSWLLPAGDYYMIARFELPDIWIYRGISFLSFLMWIGVLVSSWRKGMTITGRSA